MYTAHSNLHAETRSVGRSTFQASSKFSRHYTLAVANAARVRSPRTSYRDIGRTLPVYTRFNELMINFNYAI